jgi:hypothetical protein
MANEPGRFVDNEEVVIFEDYFEQGAHRLK